MASEEFQHVVAAATAEASASRKDLGCSYAVEFRENPDSFDPRKLVRLGKDGLRSFVNTVSVPVLGLGSVKEPQTEVDLTEPISGNLGWHDKHYVPFPFEISALLLGALAGILIVFGSAIALTI